MSSYDEIYLETDEEVTAAIDKIKKSKKKQIALCLPRHSVLGQSIVNLKLVYKQALAEGKEIALISPDKITRNLAQKVGFAVFEALDQAGFSAATPTAEPAVIPSFTKQRFGAAKTDDHTAKESVGFTTQTVETGPTVENNDVNSSEINEDSKLAIEHQNAPETQTEKIVNQAHGGMIPTKGNLRFFRQQKRRRAFAPLIVALILILAGIGVAVLFVPQATVKITVNAQPLNEKVISTVDTEAKAIDADKGIIPGKIVTVQQTTKTSAKTTGKKDIGTKSTGTVTMINEWDSLPHTLSVGTVLRAKNGNEFVLLEAVTIPGATSTVSGGQSVVVAGKKDVSVQAVLPGEAYNNAATSFTIPSILKAQQEKIYATSSAAFSGGSSSVVSTVSQEDIAKITESLKKQNRDDGVAELKKHAGDAVVIDAAIQVPSQDVSMFAEADAQVDTLEATVNGTFSVITFAKNDHSDLVKKLLANKIPQGQELATEGEGVSIDTTQFELNLASDKKLELTNNLKAFTVTLFNKNEIQRELVGANAKNATDIVKSKISANKVEINITPSGWPLLPFIKSKTTISYTYIAP